jgi:hypothetical protein
VKADLRLRLRRLSRTGSRCYSLML